MKTLYSVMCHEKGELTHHVIASSRVELKEKLVSMYGISEDAFEELIVTTHANITYTVKETNATSPVVTLFLDSTEI